MLRLELYSVFDHFGFERKVAAILCAEESAMIYAIFESSCVKSRTISSLVTENAGASSSHSLNIEYQSCARSLRR